MRRLLVLALALAALPTSAQVDVRGLAAVGYDTQFGAPSAGLAAELGWAHESSPVTLALRPSAAVVFAAETERTVTLLGDPGPTLGEESAVARLGAEVVFGSAAPVGPVAPFLTAGVSSDYQRVLRGDTEHARWQSGPTLGVGARVGRNQLQWTLGFGDASRSHLTLGVRF